MAEINLLETKSAISTVKETGKKWLLRLATLILIVVLAIYAYVFYSDWSGKREVGELKSSIAAAQAEMQNNKERAELVTRQGQLQSVNQLLSQHLFWSTLLPELARVTLTSANYSTIETSAKGDLTVTVTVPTYAEAEKYLQVFDLPEYNQQFSNVQLLALSRNQQDSTLQTTMRLQLTLNPALLKKQIQ